MALGAGRYDERDRDRQLTLLDLNSSLTVLCANVFMGRKLEGLDVSDVVVKPNTSATVTRMKMF